MRPSLATCRSIYESRGATRGIGLLKHRSAWGRSADDSCTQWLPQLRGYINDEGTRDEDRGGKHSSADDDGEIPFESCVHRQASHPVEAEDRLRHDRPAHDHGEFETAQGDDRV